MRAKAYESAMRSQPQSFHLFGGSVADKGDAFEVTWGIGDLRPHEQSESHTMTVIVGSAAGDSISVEMVARSMDRRGTCMGRGSLTVSEETWSIDAFYDAEPQG